MKSEQFMIVWRNIQQIEMMRWKNVVCQKEIHVINMWI